MANADQARRIAPIDVSIRPARHSGAVVTRDLEFDSPEALLPEPVRRVRARWISPAPQSDRVVILHAAWNDEDYRFRSRLARGLLVHDIGTVMLQHPFYGDRRREPDIETPITYVSDFALMGTAAVLEGRALASWLRDRGHRVGLSGFSMGGNIAGFVTAITDFPVASAPIAAAYSPGPVFTDAVLRTTINWDALGGETPQNVAALTEFLHAPSILRFPAPPHTASAVLLAATRDGFVPTAAVSAIHRHWPGSKMQWVTAGHAGLLWRGRHRMVGAIVESFERLGAMFPDDRQWPVSGPRALSDESTAD